MRPIPIRVGAIFLLNDERNAALDKIAHSRDEQDRFELFQHAFDNGIGQILDWHIAKLKEEGDQVEARRISRLFNR